MARQGPMLVLLQKFEGLDSGGEAPAPGSAPGRRQFTEAALTSVPAAHLAPRDGARMKQKLLWIVFALATAAQGASLDAGTRYPLELTPTSQEAQAAHLAAEVLARFHYRKVELDDALSQKVFDQYMKSLDSEKLFFVESDIDRLSADRTKLDDAILKEDLTIPFAIFNLYEQRVAERFAYARTLLKKGFDFRESESYQFVREKESWPKTEAEMRELWRKRVKNDWLRLKLAGKDDKGIVDILDKRYDNFLKRIGRVKSADAFQTYMNAYTMAIEPHTNYLGPRAVGRFRHFDETLPGRDRRDAGGDR